ncbi:MAG: hemolysin family protein [Planctomycetota bacterium]
MTPMTTWAPIIGVAAVLLGAVCSAVHQSLRSLSRSRLEDLAESRRDDADRERLNKIVDDRTGHAASVALPRVALNITAAVAFLFWIAALRAPADSTQLAFTITDALIAGAITTAALWVFGLVLPLSIATHAGERIVLTLAGPIRLMHGLTAPVRTLVNVLDEAIRRLAGAEEKNGHDAQAEILSVVEESEAEGQLDEAEREMIEGVVGFRTTSVESIMTPRTEIDAIEVSGDLVTIEQQVKEIGHSRIPVYRENLDDIVGLLYAKDLLHWLTEPGRKPDDDFDLESLVRDALFVPEQKTVRELLAELVQQKVHLAMVADEYGGTSGLVTIEDIIEEVFGDIRDEYESEEDDEPSAAFDADNRWVESDAAVHVDDLNDELEGLEVEIPESDDYDTVGGYVVTTLGRIPEAGESIELDDAKLTILEAAPTRVLKVRVERTADAPPTTTDNGDSHAPK